MSMFDDIACTAMLCPLCGSEMAWQSKDGPCLLETLTVHELMDYSPKPVFYNSCNECDVWIEVSVTRRSRRTPAQQEQFDNERAAIEEKRQARENPPEEVLQPRGFVDLGPVPGHPACQCQHGKGYHHALVGRCSAKVGTQLRCDCNAYRLPEHHTLVPPTDGFIPFNLTREEVEPPKPDPIHEISKRHWAHYLREEYRRLEDKFGKATADAFYAPYRRTGADPTEDVQ